MRGRVDAVERFASVSGAPAQGIFAAKTAVVRVLEQPDSDGAARGIILVGLSINFEEDFLGDVLRFALVTQDVDGHSTDESNVSAKERAQCVAVRSVHFGDQHGVRLFGSGNLTAAIAAPADLRDYSM
jgi:hypothetical protein